MALDGTRIRTEEPDMNGSVEIPFFRSDPRAI
jgi:hypothetical protein